MATTDLWSQHTHTPGTPSEASAEDCEHQESRQTRWSICACTEQLVGVLTRLFNLSLSRATIPPWLKSATIIPVPKTPALKCLTDYRPIVLTSVVMKCFERLILSHIKPCLPSNLDPHWFAYRANRSMGDTITIALQTAHSHLEQPGSYVRMLFIDYSLAFNTIIADILVDKLTDIAPPTPVPGSRTS